MDNVVEFALFSIPDAPNNFLLLRVVDDNATHYMDAKGMWTVLPDLDGDEEAWDFLTDPENLPVFVASPNAEAEDATPAAETQ